MATVLFNGGLATSDPVTAPVIVVGQVKHLNRVTWDTIKAKLEPRVNKEVEWLNISNVDNMFKFTHPLDMDSSSVQSVPLPHWLSVPVHEPGHGGSPPCKGVQT